MLRETLKKVENITAHANTASARLNSQVGSIVRTFTNPLGSLERKPASEISQITLLPAIKVRKNVIF